MWNVKMRLGSNVVHLLYEVDRKHLTNTRWDGVKQDMNNKNNNSKTSSNVP